MMVVGGVNITLIKEVVQIVLHWNDVEEKKWTWRRLKVDIFTRMRSD